MSFSEKVQGRHQDRLALVYVRQPSSSAGRASGWR